MPKSKKSGKGRGSAGEGGGKGGARGGASRRTGASPAADKKLLEDFFEQVSEPGEDDRSTTEFRSPMARTYLRNIALTEGAFPSEGGLAKMLNEAVGDDPDQWQYARWGAPIDDISDWMRQQYLMDVDVYSRGNPLAFHGLALITAFGIGEDVKVKAVDKERVQPIIDEHWDDPVNDWELKIEDRFMGVTSYGELCMPAFVKGKEPRKGRVRYSMIHPARILKIETDPENVEDFRSVVVSPPKAASGKRKYQIIRLDEESGLLDYDETLANPDLGDKAEYPCHYFSINRIPSVPRGISDLFPALDWLALYDDFLWTTSERARIALSVVWHVTMTNAKPDQVKAYAKKRRKVPRPNSVWVTNDRFDIRALVPELAGQDVRDTADILKHMILMALGMPDFWFADSGSANRACHSSDTETLTSLGWLDLAELQQKEGQYEIATYNPDDGCMEWHKPNSFHVYDHTGDMVHFKNKNFDILVTPDHRMWAKRDRNDDAKKGYEKVQAETMMEGNNWDVKVAANWLAPDIETFTLPECSADARTRAVFPAVDIPMDLWLEFLGYFVAEGHARGESHLVSVSQKKQDGVVKIRECLEKLPFYFGEYTDDEGCVRWQCYDKALNQWLIENTGHHCSVKKLPPFVNILSGRQLLILFEAMMLGDGWKHPGDGRRGMTYYTSSLQLAEEVQLMCFKLGMSSKIAPGQRCYRVQVIQRDEHRLGQKAMTRVDYSGQVYCFNVPNHLFITRRNTKIAITHNTSDQMGIPTSFRLLRRQRTFKAIVKRCVQFQIDQKVKLKVLDPSVDRRFEVRMPRIWLRDVTVIAKALNDIASSLLVAEQKEWVTHDQATAIYQNEAMKLGVEIDEILLEVSEKDSNARITEQQHDRLVRAKDLCDRIVAGEVTPEKVVASGQKA